jgi:hypothetical protein
MRKTAMRNRKVYLCFAPQHNTKGRHDATGAFQPEARRFIEHHGQDSSMLVLVDNRMPDKSMREKVLSTIRQYNRSLNGIFFFCHGFKGGIQFGFRSKNVEELTAAMSTAFWFEDGVVCCYSCDVARDADRDRYDETETIGGDGGFADLVRDGLCRAGCIYCHVDGHTTTGHTTKNPFVRRFEGAGSFIGGHGGLYIVSPGKKQLFKKWRDLLKTDYRFDYPLVGTAVIYEELQQI